MTSATPQGDTLGAMELGSRALVSRIGGAAPVARRLLEMGLLPGTEITAVRRAAMGDPLEVSLRGYHLSVRLSDGHVIEVLPLAGAPAPAPELPALGPTPPERIRRVDDRPTLPRVLLAGNPNAGKTTVFNALTGSRARVGNYPGVTVEQRVGNIELESGACDLVDLPGTYSLSARSLEEKVAVDALLGEHGEAPDVVVLIVDSGALERNLYLALQILETGLPVVLGLNMSDEAEARGVHIDAAALGASLACEAVSMTASRGEGLEELRAAIDRALTKAPVEEPLTLPYSKAVATEVARVEAALSPQEMPARRRSRALWALLSYAPEGIPGADPALELAVQQAFKNFGPALTTEIVTARYAYLAPRVAASVTQGEDKSSGWTNRIDSVLTHPLMGTIFFTLIMGLFFQLLFAWCDPLIGLVEAGVGGTQGWVEATLPPGFFNDLLREGVIAGVGNVVVFAPQIAALFLVIGFLEDCGYLARVAFLLDRAMGGVGLHGKAFVPMLSGFACAIPAAMATRTIESRLDRLLTMMTLPFMSCAARLPVYVLLIAVVFPAQATIFGGISLGAVVLGGMYALSVAATLLAAALLRRSILQGPRPPLVLELPPYRMPLVRNLLTSTWIRLKKFLVDAGTIILAMTILLWVLLTFPKVEALEARLAARELEIATIAPDDSRQIQLEVFQGEASRARLEASYAGRLGKAIEPVFKPLGFDWRVTVGVIGAFAAREVFVSTMGVVFGIQEADEENVPLRESLQAAEWPDGRKLLTPASGLSLMVFFVLACQCMSTLAEIQRESGSWKWPTLLFVMMTVMAYGASFVVFQVGTALGY